MSASRWISIAATALASLGLAGCSPSFLWGDKVVYSPVVHGYAFEEIKDKVPIVDRITGKKLRCAEDVARVLPDDALAKATYAHDNGRAVTAALPADIVTFPVAGPGAILIVGGGILEGGPFLMEYVGSPPSDDSLFSSGKKAFDANRKDDARSLFERALAREIERGERRCNYCESARSLYYLGRLEEEQGRPGDAKRDYLEFLERATVPARDDYDDAEARLAKIDREALPKCASQAPIPVAWPKAR